MRGDTAPVPENTTSEAVTETQVSDDAPEETADTATVEASDDTDDASDTNMKTDAEDENTETLTEPEQPEETEETGYVKPAGQINGYDNPELVPKPTDYGVSIKSMDDLPDVSQYGWNYENLPLKFCFTSKGYVCCVDGLNNMTYYACHMLPNGTFFGGDKENLALWDYCEKKGYDSGYEITYEEAKELFGEADMSTAKGSLTELMGQ